MLHLRYGRLGSFLTLRALCMCLYFYFLVIPFVFYFCPHFGLLAGCLCCILSTGRRSLVHIFVIFCFLYFFLHTLLYLSRERVVRNDSLIQRLGRQRSRGSVKTITLGHGTRVTDAFFRNPRGHGPHGPRVGYVLSWKFFLEEASLGAALASELPPSFPMYVLD